MRGDSARARDHEGCGGRSALNKGGAMGIANVARAAGPDVRPDTADRKGSGVSTRRRTRKEAEGARWGEPPHRGSSSETVAASEASGGDAAGAEWRLRAGKRTETRAPPIRTQARRRSVETGSRGDGRFSLRDGGAGEGQARGEEARPRSVSRARAVGGRDAGTTTGREERPELAQGQTARRCQLGFHGAPEPSAGTERGPSSRSGGRSASGGRKGRTGYQCTDSREEATGPR